MGLAVTVVAAAATLPTVDNGTASPPWTVDAIDQVDDDVAAAVDGEPGVLVEMGSHLAVGASAPALFGVLQDAGVPFYVDDVALVRQLGTARAYEPGDATVRLVVRGGRFDRARPGERLVAASEPMSSAEERELARLTGEVREIVDRHGLPLAEQARSVFTMLDQLDEVDRIAAVADDPDEALSSGLVRRLWANGALTDLAGGPLLDTRVFPAELLDRWSELDERSENQSSTSTSHLSPEQRCRTPSVPSSPRWAGCSLDGGCCRARRRSGSPASWGAAGGGLEAVTIGATLPTPADVPGRLGLPHGARQRAAVLPRRQQERRPAGRPGGRLDPADVAGVARREGRRRLAGGARRGPPRPGRPRGPSRPTPTATGP